MIIYMRLLHELLSFYNMVNFGEFDRKITMHQALSGISKLGILYLERYNGSCNSLRSHDQ
jgi:hypothetical protein